MSDPKPGEKLGHNGKEYFAVANPKNVCTRCEFVDRPTKECPRKYNALYCHNTIWLTQADFIIHRLTN